MDNPHDDTSWLRVVNFPTRGIGARTLEQLADLARQQDSSLFRAVPLMSGKGGGNLARFAELIQQMAHEAQILSLPELIDHVVHHRDRKSTRLNSSHSCASRMPSSACKTKPTTTSATQDMHTTQLTT